MFVSPAESMFTIHPPREDTLITSLLFPVLYPPHKKAAKMLKKKKLSSYYCRRATEHDRNVANIFQESLGNPLRRVDEEFDGCFLVSLLVYRYVSLCGKILV